MLPSGISSHPYPDIDHSSRVEFQGRSPNKKRRKSSRLFTLMVYMLIHKHGVVFPIETCK
jgi:hypothetical protein